MGRLRADIGKTAPRRQYELRMFRPQIGLLILIVSIQYNMCENTSGKPSPCISSQLYLTVSKSVNSI